MGTIMKKDIESEETRKPDYPGAIDNSGPTGNPPPRPPRHLILQMRDCETDIINVVNQEISSRGLNAYLMTYILKNVAEQIDKAAQTEIATVVALEQSTQ